MTMPPTGPLRVTPKVLRHVYQETLSRVAPSELLRSAITSGRLALPRATAGVLSVGKCAVPLASAILDHTACRRVLAIAPEGYAAGSPDGVELLEGSHPELSEKSRVAARRAREFVRESRGPVLFLVSGGASACMEDALEPFVRFDELVRVNALLLASGLGIDAINTVRRHLSSIKGGRLGSIAPRGSTTLVYSDVPPGREDLVGSGPTLGDPTTLDEAAKILDLLDDPVCRDLSNRMRRGEIPETRVESPTNWGVIADSEVMVAAAIDVCDELGFGVRPSAALCFDVDAEADRLAEEAARLRRGEILVTAGEVTVSVVRGDGVGGRCSELASRFVLYSDVRGKHDSIGLFGTSDGRDGSSPAGAVIVNSGSRNRLSNEVAAEALSRSASYELVSEFGEPIMMGPTGNNLRDIVLLASEERDD